TLEVWNWPTRTLIRRIETGTTGVSAVAFGVDDKTAIAACKDGSVQFRNMLDGKLRHSRTTHAEGRIALVVSADKSVVVTGGEEGTLVFWDARNGRKRKTVFAHQSDINDLALSPDGRWLVSASDDKTAVVWDVARRDRVHTFIDHGRAVTAVAISPDNQLVVSGGEDSSIQVWSLKTGTVFKTLTQDVGVARSLLISPDGTTAYGRTGSRLRAWNLESGATTQYTNLGDTILAVTPDRRQVVLGGFDFKTVEIAALDRADVTASAPVGGNWRVQALRYSPDGKHLIATNHVGAPMRVWNLAEGTVERAFVLEGEIASLAFSDREPIVAFGLKSGGMEVWNYQTGKRRWHLRTTRDTTVGAIAISPDGQTIASGTWEEPGVAIRDHKGSKFRELNTDVGIGAVAFSPEGKTLYVGKVNGAIEVWDVERQERRRSFFAHDGAIGALAVSPDERYLVSGGTDLGDRTTYDNAKVWDLRTDRLQQTLEGGSTSFRSLAFSPDNSTVVVNYSISALAWQWQTDRKPTYWGIREAYALSPDGQAIAGIAGNDKETIHIWKTSDIVE
ncbi:MAG: WD40 repeat domain-containing protein, partial [Cyanobacteria bacterium J06648_11]